MTGACGSWASTPGAGTARSIARPAQALARQEPGIFWAAHQCDLPYSQIERLVNLAALPPFGFTVSCFPLKIQGGSAGPTRAVAILEGEMADVRSDV